MNGKQRLCYARTSRFSFGNDTFKILPREVLHSILTYGLEDLPEIVATCRVLSSSWPDIFNTYLKTPFLTQGFEPMALIRLYQEADPNEEELKSCAGPYHFYLDDPMVKEFALLQYIFRRRNVADLYDAILMLADAFCDTHVPCWRSIWFDKRRELPMLLRRNALSLLVDCDALMSNEGDFSRVISNNIVTCLLNPVTSPPEGFSYVSVDNLLEAFNKYVLHFLYKKRQLKILSVSSNFKANFAAQE